MSVARGLGAAVTPNYSIDEILRQTGSATRTPSTARRMFGTLIGAAGNLALPGIGGAIGNMIAGGTLNSTGLLGDTTQYLELQRQMNQETRAFETASAVLKSRHDAAMAAIHNLK